MKHEVLYLCHLYKQRGKENVLAGVDLRLYQGELIFLLGREGSGKTTLAEIMSGRIQPDMGAIFWQDKRVTLNGPHAANRRGIHLINERSRLFDNLSLGENICIRNPVRFSLGGYVAKVEASAAILCEELHIDINPHALPRDVELSLLDRILIETARAVYQRARIIIFDNLLWMLASEERARLFVLLEQLKKNGITSIVCASEFGHICEAADRVVFLDHGAIAADYDRMDLCWPAANRLFGEPLLLSAMYPAQSDDAGAGQRRIFRFRNYDERDVTIDLTPGESVGIYCPAIRRYRMMLGRLSDESWINAQNNSLGWNRGTDDICSITLANLYHDCFLQLSVAENVILTALEEVLPPVHLTLRDSSTFLREEICSLLSIDRARWDEPAHRCTRSERSELVLYRALAREKHLIVLAGLLDEPNAERRLMLARFVRDASVRKKSIVLLSREEKLLRELCDRVICI